MGIVNTRSYDHDVDISLHTLAIERGLRIGAHLFAAKMEYSIGYLGRKEVLITAESPIGFRRWMIEYGLELRDGQHELGGATPYALTRELYFRNKDRVVAGERPVPPELLEQAERDYCRQRGRYREENPRCEEEEEPMRPVVIAGVGMIPFERRDEDSFVDMLAMAGL